MNTDSDYDQLLLANFIRDIGQPFLSVLLGGAVGITFLATFLSIRQQFHSSHVVENISFYNPATVDRLDGLKDYFSGLGADSFLAQEQAISAIARRESMVMAYNDGFYFVGVAFLFGACVTYTLKPFRPQS